MDWSIYAVGAIIGACLLAAVITAIRKMVEGRRSSSVETVDSEHDEHLRNRRLAAARRSRIKVNPNSFPEELRPLAPLAEYWGICDDDIRIGCILAATPDERAHLLAMVEMHKLPLVKWLQETDVTQSDDWAAMAFMETAAAELKEMEKDLG